MKGIPKLIAFILYIGIVFFISCKKEHSCENCVEKNKPPIANAGKDTIIVLPVDSVKVDGSLSSDPDGTITNFLWTKISGPASFNINSATTARTIVKNLSVGSYQFELKITDNMGLSAKDTMIVTVDATSTTNHPPIANAGHDTTITLPVNTVNLDGSGSTDPDNNITSYAWTKISGPSLFNIANTNTVQTEVTNLVEGIYQFELKVTDAGGLFSKDTVQLIVNSQGFTNCIQTIPFGNLSFSDYIVKIVTAGNKILFSTDSRVDIYDTLTNTWSTTILSQARIFYAVASSGNKAFFAGGRIDQDGWEQTTRVDIFDASTNTWSTAELSQPREGLAATSLGNKIYFGGGGSYDYGTSDVVDIFDISSNSWTVTHLSEPRISLAAASSNNKVYFAGGRYGGASNKIDILDAVTNTWSTSTMAEPKFEMGCIPASNKIFFVGGENMTGPPFWSDLVDVYDVVTGSHTIHHMSGIPNNSYNNNIVIKDNKILFLIISANSFKIEMFDLNTDAWSVCEIPGYIQAIGSIGNKAFGALGFQNGSYNNHVWKLEF
ncbi:MAG TPA: PKD domain-containing protein [Chitinophagaceae bacterium]|jgi:hypothetical protein|nr:PKD domain-containing protein [Chitinophagaceae bacterium]